MPSPSPFQPDGVGGAELFADPNAYTPAYHNARARELERRAATTSNVALADLRGIARRHSATALALAAAARPASSVAARASSVASRSFARRALTARSA